MSIKNAQIALLRHLNLLQPLIPTGYEGASFKPPDSMYQRVQFNIGRPVDPVLGTGYFREDVELQIFVNAPVNQGTGEALDRAELLRKHFAKGLALPEQGDMLHVLTTPQIAGCAVIGNRVIVPVIISVTVEVLC